MTTTSIRVIFTIAFSLIAYTTQACLSHDNDTTLIIAPDIVRLINNKTDYQIEIKGTEGNPNFHFTYTSIQDSLTLTQTRKGLQREDWNFKIPFVENENKYYYNSHLSLGFMEGAYFGFHHVLNIPTSTDWKIGKNMSCAIYNLLFLEWRPWLNRNSFSMGIGFGGDIYSMEGSQRLAKQNGNIILTDYPEGITPQKTTINYPFVCLTPLYRIDLGKPENRIALHIGPIVKFNFKGRLSAIGKNEMGEEVSYASKSLPLRPVTVDLSAFLYYKYICIYAQYSPCKIFKAGRGPQINTLSVGVGLRLY